METLRITQPLHLDGVVLIPVQRVRVEPSQACGGVWVHACAEPRAVVFNAGGHWRALDAHGAELPLGPLLEDVAGLADAVERERRDGGHSWSFEPTEDVLNVPVPFEETRS